MTKNNLNTEISQVNLKAKITVKTINQKEFEILDFWNQNKIFEKSLIKPADGEPKDNFTFYDGPPFATGLPHHGHLLASTIKDAIPRYQTMQGNSVRRVWGWDTHGLPLENLVEKELNLKHKKEIEEYGLEKFTEKAKSLMLTYETEWKKIIPRIGRWVDMENAYKTMDTNYTESIWWSFKTLYEKKLIYEGYKVLYICPRCETTLAHSEVALGYKDLTDISVIAKFELVDEPQTFLLAWTTTPWTLPGNTALALNKNFDYVKITAGDEKFILAKERLEYLKNILNKKNTEKSIEKNIEINTESSIENKRNVEEEIFEEIEIINIQDLLGKKYKPVFNLNLDKLQIKNLENLYKIWHADFINMETGTGIAHQAPAFGAEDLDLARQNNLPIIHHVNLAGNFISEVIQELQDKKIAEEDVKNICVKIKTDNQATDILIIKYLAKMNLLLAKEKIIHSYPTCWRCETPLLNYATFSWFMNVPVIKEKNLQANQKINWVPNHLQEGRFGKWLEGAREWALSRQRYWGAPLPVWKCVNINCKKIKVIGSLEELQKFSINNSVSKNKSGEIDLHRPYIDAIKFQCECGQEMQRIVDVFDCWYESGAMPFASLHYPFENQELFQKNFPADFIAEGLDQTRGWFYSLLNLSVGLFDQTAFQNVIVNGMVMASDNEKMSKSKKNYTDPMVLVEKYGADAFRLALLTSPLMNGENILFQDSIVEETYKKIISKLENVLSFFVMNINSDNSKKIFEKISMHKNNLENNLAKNNISENILDIWILARFNEIIFNTTEAMNKYHLNLATRDLEKFIDDLSTWYLRRSRERLKNGDLEAQIILYLTLNEFSKLIAPFMPFLSERIYQDINKNNLEKRESVHLESWPNQIRLFDSEKDSENFSEKVLSGMETVRNIVSQALMIRQQNQIPVRQPLASLSLKKDQNFNFENLEKYFNLIKDELNVQKIILNPENEQDIKLDLEITDDLKRLGEIRELIRQIKDFRKANNFLATDWIAITFKTSLDRQKFIESVKDRILQETKLSNIDFEIASDSESEEEIILK